MRPRLHLLSNFADLISRTDTEMRSRIAFIDFVKGLLNLDPEQRWTPQQARLHPFVLGEQLTQPFVPPPHVKSYSTNGSQSSAAAAQAAAQAAAAASTPNPKQPYGGLPPAPSSNRLSRTYDAKSYSQHLTQQQSYTLQAQQAAQRAAQVPTNPYRLPDVGPSQQQQQMYAGGQARIPQQQLQQPPYSSFGYAQAAPTSQQQQQQQQVLIANPPAAHHYTTSRGRSNTGGTQELPPALQKFGRDLGVPGGSGQSVTPV